MREGLETTCEAVHTTSKVFVNSQTARPVKWKGDSLPSANALVAASILRAVRSLNPLDADRSSPSVSEIMNDISLRGYGCQAYTEAYVGKWDCAPFIPFLCAGSDWKATKRGQTYI